MEIPVIDLFAGPGGLGEGFSSYQNSSSSPFQIVLSVEKDPVAHKTLKTRALIRQFKNEIPDDYYEFLRSDKSVFADHLDRRLFEKQIRNAESEAQNLTLGPDNNKIRNLISNRLKGKEFILIGGPPCQAYSLIGRSRMKGTVDFESDERHYLYKHYLSVIAEFKPAVFVMENVKGLLSSKLNGELIFDRIREDLSRPGSAVNGGNGNSLRYNIFPFVSTDSPKLPDLIEPKDFIIKSEKYGIPQERHRVILMGIRDDKEAGSSTENILKESPFFSVEDAIKDLPELRSRISKGTDSFENWKSVLSELPEMISEELPEVIQEINNVICELGKRDNELPTGARYTAEKMSKNRAGKFIKDNWDWFFDERIRGIINHESRSHMVSDLQRYLWCSAYAKVMDKSPRINDFPDNLLPEHKNIIKGRQIHFPDRFKVQLADKPSKTITSHISKDGHYYIHYDPIQCRSLTVREAARIQTFPDNYFFEGNRTQQYHQIGNAVPPLLARKLAGIVFKIMVERKEV